MRIGTRRSALALAQAELVAGLLGGAARSSRCAPAATRMPRAPAQGPTSRAGWRELEQRARRRGRSTSRCTPPRTFPASWPTGSRCSAPRRGRRPRTCCAERAALDALRPGARVGTSSLRRAAQLRAAREDLEVVAIARQRRHAPAQAGRPRRGPRRDRARARRAAAAGARGARSAAVLDPERFVPAPGQGTLALEGRADDARTREARAGDHRRATPSRACWPSARWRAALGASCHTPLGRPRRAAPAAAACCCAPGWGCPTARRGSRRAARRASDDPEALGRRVARGCCGWRRAALLERAEAKAA